MIVRLLLRKNSSRFQIPKVERISHEDSQAHSYLVYCNETGQAAVIDPAHSHPSNNQKSSPIAIDKVISKIKSANLSLEYTLNTHYCPSHSSSLELIQKAFPEVKCAIGANVINAQASFQKDFPLKSPELISNDHDILFKHHQKFKIGKIEAKALNTPSYIIPSSVYQIGDSIFTGRAVFHLDHDVSISDDFDSIDAQLYLKIHKVFKLTESYRVYTGINQILSEQKRKTLSENSEFSYKFN